MKLVGAIIIWIVEFFIRFVRRGFSSNWPILRFGDDSMTQFRLSDLLVCEKDELSRFSSSFPHFIFLGESLFSYTIWVIRLSPSPNLRNVLQSGFPLWSHGNLNWRKKALRYINKHISGHRFCTLGLARMPFLFSLKRILLRSIVANQIGSVMSQLQYTMYKLIFTRSETSKMIDVVRRKYFIEFLLVVTKLKWFCNVTIS